MQKYRTSRIAISYACVSDHSVEKKTRNVQDVYANLLLFTIIAHIDAKEIAIGGER